MDNSHRKILATHLFVGLWLLVSASVLAHAKEQPAWKPVIDWCKTRHKKAVKELGALTDEVEQRCAKNNLKHCSSILRPKARPSGYQLLPDLLEDSKPSAHSPYTTVYSLERLTENLGNTKRDIDLLKRQLTRKIILQASVDEYIRIRKHLDNLEAHVKYHAYWQQAAVDYRAWYAKRRPLATRARALMKTWNAKAPGRAKLRTELVDKLKPFKARSQGVECRTTEGGHRLSVTVHTDILDPQLGMAFENAIARYYTGATTNGSFSLVVELEYIAANTLYDGKPPATGSPINERKHRERFGKKRLVLTTGATATHAFTGRSIHLSSQTVTPRQLAHETGHLLGFNDVYLRHFISHKTPRYGAIFTEWAGLQNDIMGNSRGGQVTTAMRDQLVKAYCQP